MGDMARARSGRTPTPAPAGWVSALVLLALLGCTAEPQPDDPPDDVAELSVPLQLTTVAPDRFPDSDRTEMEGEVGELLSAYVVSAFLGDYPRDSFVRSFDHFTGRAAELATADLEVLTAAGNDDLATVDATRLDARLSFLTLDDVVLGATAHVRFIFDATASDGTVQRLQLTGRLMLERDSDRWSVFGYDVASDDGAAVSEDPS
jgi:hypothetical protein